MVCFDQEVSSFQPESLNHSIQVNYININRSVHDVIPLSINILYFLLNSKRMKKV